MLSNIVYKRYAWGIGCMAALSLLWIRMGGIGGVVGVAADFAQGAERTGIDRAFVTQLLGIDRTQVYAIIVLDDEQPTVFGGSSQLLAIVHVTQGIPTLVGVYPLHPTEAMLRQVQVDEHVIDFPSFGIHMAEVLVRDSRFSLARVDAVVGVTFAALNTIAATAGPFVLQGQTLTAENTGEAVRSLVKSRSREEIIRELGALEKTVQSGLLYHQQTYLALARELFARKIVALYHTDPVIEKVLIIQGMSHLLTIPEDR